MVKVVVNPGYKVRDKSRGRDASEGEVIDVPEKEAKLLRGLRRVSDPKPESMAKPSQPPELPAVVPVTAPVARDVVVEEAPSEDPQSTRRRYQRRDLQATE